jgi:hypothetical protein
LSSPSPVVVEGEVVVVEGEVVVGRRREGGGKESRRWLMRIATTPLGMYYSRGEA